MTELARQVVVVAQQEARGLAHDYVGSEHLLLGLLAVDGDVAGGALSSRGVLLPLVRSRVARRVGVGERDSPEAIPFTPRAKRIIALAAEEALGRKDEHIGTEHLLLAILCEHEAVAAGILRHLDVDPDHIRRLIRPAPLATEPHRPAETPAAAAEDAAGVPGPQVTIREITPEVFSDAREFAHAFGSAVCEPTWWPPDTEQISYRLYRSSGREHYEIGSVRRDGIPICVVGHREAALGGRSPRDWLTGEWSEPPGLAHLRGLIGAVGIPRRLQAVVYDSGLQLQLIGYDTEQEITRATNSLRRTKSAP